MDLTGLSRHTVQALVRYMRTLRMVYVSEWIKPEPGGLLAVWKLGDKRNATKPKRQNVHQARMARLAAADQREQGRQFTHLIAAPLAQ